MQLNEKAKHIGGIATAIASALGAVIFLFWQPVNDYFVSKIYDDNIVLQIDADTLSTSNEQTILAIRVRVSNRGTVPVQLNNFSNSELNLEVRKIDKLQQGIWVDSSSQTLVAKKIVLHTNDLPVMVSANSYWAKEIAIPISVGAYVLQASLKKKDGTKVYEEIFFQVKK